MCIRHHTHCSVSWSPWRNEVQQSLHCLQCVEEVVRLSKLEIKNDDWVWQSSRSLTLSVVLVWHRISSNKHRTSLLFLYPNREGSVLTNEIPEESDQFRFLRVDSYTNIKGSVGLIWTKVSVMSLSIPLDLSSRSFCTITVFHSFEVSLVSS
jgi:hypothetical protein